MRHRFFDLAFTPAVQAEQARHGSRAGYAALSARRRDGATADVLEEQEFSFIAERDSFYLATVSEIGLALCATPRRSGGLRPTGR